MKTIAFLILITFFTTTIFGQNSDIMPTTNYATLKTALSNKDSATISTLLEQHPEVLDSVENGVSGLMLIAYFHNQPALELALTQKQTFTLHEAAATGQLAIVQQQLGQNPETINTFAADGFAPLTLACFFGQKEVVKYLIEQGAAVNIVAQNPSKVMPLHSAVARNDFEICQILVQNGADVNVAQIQGVTALHSAAHRGNLGIVKLLVENGAKVEAAMENGDTALIFAERDGHQEVLDYLKSKIAK